MVKQKTVGVLALQGDFREHEEMLQNLGVSVLQVKLPSDLDQVDRLIIPGGESTTIGKLMDLYKLTGAIKVAAKKGMPIWGTCAGAILLSKNIVGNKKEGQIGLGLMDISASRNAFGRQLDSFESELKITGLGEDPFPAVFIRAPKLLDPGSNVRVLAETEKGVVVAARQEKILATCFHPELTSDNRVHKYFLDL